MIVVVVLWAIALVLAVLVAHRRAYSAGAMDVVDALLDAGASISREQLDAARERLWPGDVGRVERPRTAGDGSER